MHVEDEPTNDIVTSVIQWLKTEQPYKWLAHARHIEVCDPEFLQLPHSERVKLDLNERLLCEMPLCGAIPTVVTSPPGFSCVGMYVKINNQEQLIPHYFLYSINQNIVVCLTAGQFADSITGSEVTGFGRRINTMQKIGNDLGIEFIVDTTGNTVMIATPQQILATFGINYFYKRLEITSDMEIALLGADTQQHDID